MYVCTLLRSLNCLSGDWRHKSFSDMCSSIDSRVSWSVVVFFLLFILMWKLIRACRYQIMALRRCLQSSLRTSVRSLHLLEAPLYASAYSRPYDRAGVIDSCNIRKGLEWKSNRFASSDATSSMKDQEKLVLYRAKWMRPLRVMVRWYPFLSSCQNPNSFSCTQFSKMSLPFEIGLWRREHVECCFNLNCSR